MLRELGPERRGGGRVVVPQRDCALAANGCVFVVDELIHQRNHIKTSFAGDAQAGDADVRIGILKRRADVFFLQALDTGEQMQRARAQALVVALPKLAQRAFGLRADFVQLLPAYEAFGYVWRGQHRESGAFFRNGVFGILAFGREPVDAAGHLARLVVGHVVTADMAVVPVRDEHRTVRSRADIRRAIPRILALQHVDDLALVAGAALGDRVSSHHAGAGVAVHHLALKSFRQQTAFVDGDASR